MASEKALGIPALKGNIGTHTGVILVIRSMTYPSKTQKKVQNVTKESTTPNIFHIINGNQYVAI